MLALATVATTSPLTVTLDRASTPQPAKVVGGVAYTPVIADRVLVDPQPVAGLTRILGEA